MLHASLRVSAALACCLLCGHRLSPKYPMDIYELSNNAVVSSPSVFFLIQSWLRIRNRCCQNIKNILKKRKKNCLFIDKLFQVHCVQIPSNPIQLYIIYDHFKIISLFLEAPIVFSQPHRKLKKTPLLNYVQTTTSGQVLPEGSYSSQFCAE